MRVLAALLLCVASAARAQDPHAGHTMPPAAVPSEMDMEVSAPDPAAPPPAPAVGNAPAPAPPTDHWADRDFPPAEMAAARADAARLRAVAEGLKDQLAQSQARKARPNP